MDSIIQSGMALVATFKVMCGIFTVVPERQENGRCGTHKQPHPPTNAYHCDLWNGTLGL